MELGLQFEDILCYEATAAISSAHEESLETAIPEYCPDIARIVEAPDDSGKAAERGALHHLRQREGHGALYLRGGDRTAESHHVGAVFLRDGRPHLDTVRNGLRRRPCAADGGSGRHLP